MKNKKMSKMGRHQQKGRPSKMLTPTEISVIQDLAEQGKSQVKISELTGFSRKTIRFYLSGGIREGGFLERHKEQIFQWFKDCEGHCPPLKRKIEEELGKSINLRSLQRFCKALHKELTNNPRTIRYETKPGQQMQIDFGEKDVCINKQIIRAHFIVCSLGFSRRIFVKAYPAENQGAWLDGIESAFAFFDAIPVFLLSDNSRCLVTEHRRRGETRLTAGYESFCAYWKLIPIAATPRHPQCKGKVERAVRYVKENALVGKEFQSLEDLNSWLEQWSLTQADERILDQFKTGLKTPKERFQIEKEAMRVFDKPRKVRVFTETRRVDENGLVRIDNKFYPLPEDVKNADVQIQIIDTNITVSKDGVVVAELDKVEEVYQPKEQPKENLKDIPNNDKEMKQNPLQRPISAYAQALGGDW